MGIWVRSRWAIFLACVGLAAVVAGCGGDDEPEALGTVGKITGPAASEVAPWAAAGKIPKGTKVTVCFFAGPELDALRKYAPEFEAYTKNRVSVEFVEIPTAQILEGTLTQLRSKSAACDLVDDPANQAPVIEPYLEPLEPLMEDPGLFNAEAYNLDDFPTAVLDLHKVTGDGLMSLPLNTSGKFFFYRKDLFAKWGIDVPVAPESWSWDELYDAMETVRTKVAEEGVEGMWPIVFSGDKTQDGGITALMSMWSAGGDPLKDGKPNFQDPKVVEGFKQWVGLATDAKVASPGVGGYAYAEVLTALQQEKAASALQWVTAAGALGNPEDSPTTAGKLGFGLFPYGGDSADTPRIFPATHTLGINKASKNKQAAFEFAVWYTSPEIQRRQLETGEGIAGRTSQMTDPELLETHPEFATMNEALKLFHALPDVPSLAAMLEQVVAPQANSAVTGGQSVEEAIDNMQEGAESFLQKAGG